VILIKYNNQTVKERAFNDSTDRSAVQSTDNPPHSGGLGVVYRTELDNLAFNSVFEIWLYREMISTQIVQFSPPFHLPISDTWADHYSLSRYQKPTNFG